MDFFGRSNRSTNIKNGQHCIFRFMLLHLRFDQYDAIFGDDPEAYLSFLDTLEATLTKSKRNLIQAAASQDWNVISATRHSLKPTMTLLGAEPINDLLHEWRPTMSDLDATLLDRMLSQVLEAVSEKKAKTE